MEELFCVFDAMLECQTIIQIVYFTHSIYYVYSILLRKWIYHNTVVL